MDNILLDSMMLRQKQPLQSVDKNNIYYKVCVYWINKSEVDSQLNFYMQSASLTNLLLM